MYSKRKQGDTIGQKRKNSKSFINGIIKSDNSCYSSYINKTDIMLIVEYRYLEKTCNFNERGI